MPAMTASLKTIRKTRRPVRRLARRLVATVAILTPLIGGVSPWAHSRAQAGFPETFDRTGRLIGSGWGDGYHSCHSSGVRPLANLPPRSYAARVGTFGEKIAGCATCGPRALPGVGPITAPGGPQTFYHRFDLYAAQVSHREAYAAASRPVQPIYDPEQGIAGNQYSPRESGGFNSAARDRFRDATREAENKTRRAEQSENSTADGTPAAPALSVDELAEFREYQSERREREKVEKYLIEPDEFEPSQSFGGPPVGSQERRRLDENEVRELQRKLRLRRDQATRPSERLRGYGEDRLPSSSDQGLPEPTDELLPPSPRELDRPTQERRNRDSLPNGIDLEEVPRGTTQRVDELDSARREFLRQPDSTQNRLEFNAPRQSNHTARGDENDRNRDNRVTQPQPAFAPVTQPQARIAEVPHWRFVKQPQ